MAYGDDNNYVKINAISDDGQTPGQPLELRSEVGGTVSAIPTASAGHAPRRRPGRSGCG